MITCSYAQNVHILCMFIFVIYAKNRSFLLVFLSFFDEIVSEPYFTSALLILDAPNTNQLNGTHWHHC